MGRVELAARGGLEVESVLTTLASHATPGSETVQVTSQTAGLARTGTYRRLLDLGGGPTAICLHLHPGGIGLDAPDSVITSVAQLVTWWFDLDTDPAPVADHLMKDPRLTALVRERPSLRPVRHPAGFEAAIDTVLGQQVTLASGRLFGQRLRSAYSPDTVNGLRPFPEPGALASAPLEDLRAAVGLTTARARTVQAVAALFADGFQLGPGGDPAAVRAALIALPGVGPWTVEYLALRALGDPDAFPSSDAVVRRALGGAPAREAERVAEAWRPHRAWATAHLWAGQSLT